MRHDEMNDPDRWDRMIANYEEQADPFTRRFAEAAVARLPIGPDTRVLDIATGVGAAAFAAAARGAQVLATDFAPGLIARLAAKAGGTIETRVMDGQALALPDAAFDVTMSMFGIMLFPDWRKGLLEMARVTRPGGTGVLGTWKHPAGAATNLLLTEILCERFPELELPAMPEGMGALRDPARLARAMEAAGFETPDIIEVTHDFELRLSTFDDPDRILGLMPHWTMLTADQKLEAVAEIRRRAAVSAVGDVLPIPSTALIAIARR
ncbi:class I SAM-dependent methyltransferase [Sphingosinicella sp. BN140058]|uniref:class I SAM-dependent methyltransferase n=1 Tax=Sphingosinicella sp. BN140058 TaxID=1892855 RepID=UPI0010102043|nr:class I SAM-dependent methyltransferase [Sphingosinicella sp. BN140058]QAY76988.1 class I SAM-dependent methyltransferase [Sphingosinicella sp. BN140058]